MNYGLSSDVSSEREDEEVTLTLAELCSACQLNADEVIEWVDQGILDANGKAPEGWRFRSLNIQRVRRARRLIRDLGVSSQDMALVLDLLEEVQMLRDQVRRLDS